MSTKRKRLWPRGLDRLPPASRLRPLYLFLTQAVIKRSNDNKGRKLRPLTFATKRTRPGPMIHPTALIDVSKGGIHFVLIIEYELNWMAYQMTRVPKVGRTFKEGTNSFSHSYSRTEMSGPQREHFKIECHGSARTLQM